MFRWLLRAARNRHCHRVPDKKVQHRARLGLEQLEDRIAPAGYTFDGPGSDWNALGNWTVGGAAATRLPGAADDVTIAGGQTAVLGSGQQATVKSVALDPSSSLAVAGTLSDDGTLNVSSATLDVSGKLDVGASAVFFGVGTVTIESTGDLDDSGTLDSSLTNMGSPPLGIIVDGKLEFGSTATQAGISGPLNIVQNQSLGIDGDVEVGTSATISSNNVIIGGILDAKNISAFAGANIDLTGTGDILNFGNIETGILATATFTHFSNYTIEPGGELHGEGTYVIDGPVTVAGNLTQPGAIQLNNDGLTTEGSLVGGGDLELNEDFTWTGGTISLGGGVSLPINSDFTIAGPNTCTLATTSLTFDVNSPLSLVISGAYLVAAGACMAWRAGPHYRIFRHPYGFSGAHPFPRRAHPFRPIASQGIHDNWLVAIRKIVQVGHAIRFPKFSFGWKSERQRNIAWQVGSLA